MPSHETASTTPSASAPAEGLDPTASAALTPVVAPVIRVENEDERARKAAVRDEILAAYGMPAPVHDHHPADEVRPAPGRRARRQRTREGDRGFYRHIGHANLERIGMELVTDDATGSAHVAQAQQPPYTIISGFDAMHRRRRLPHGLVEGTGVTEVERNPKKPAARTVLQGSVSNKLNEIGDAISKRRSRISEEEELWHGYDLHDKEALKKQLRDDRVHGEKSRAIKGAGALVRRLEKRNERGLEKLRRAATGTNVHAGSVIKRQKVSKIHGKGVDAVANLISEHGLPDSPERRERRADRDHIWQLEENLGAVWSDDIHTYRLGAKNRDGTFSVSLFDRDGNRHETANLTLAEIRALTPSSDQENDTTFSSFWDGQPAANETVPATKEKLTRLMGRAAVKGTVKVLNVAGTALMELDRAVIGKASEKIADKSLEFRAGSTWEAAGGRTYRLGGKQADGSFAVSVSDSENRIERAGSMTPEAIRRSRSHLKRS